MTSGALGLDCAPMRLFSARTLLFALLSPLACAGAQRVQLYDGPQLPAEQVGVLVNNPHLVLSVDRRFAIGPDHRKKRHRIEVDPGHHAVEVQCIYPNDVPYHASTGDGPVPALSEEGKKYTSSPPIALMLDAEAGHVYKLRTHFTRNPQGIPGCRVKLFDVTSESGGDGVDLY